MASERDDPVYLSRKAGDCFLIEKIVVQVDRVTQQIVVFAVEEKRISVRRGHSRRLGDLPIRVTVRDISGVAARLTLEGLTTNPTTPKRWRPRWSLRTLVILVTLVCCYAACWGPTNTNGIEDVDAYYGHGWSPNDLGPSRTSHGWCASRFTSARN